MACALRRDAGLLFMLSLPQGKDKPFFTPWGDVGDVVIVKNAAHVNFTGAKWDDEHHYQWHTG